MAQAPPDLLTRVPLFADLPRRDLERIANGMKARRFAAGDVVAREGESGVGFFVVEDGRATVTVGGREVAKIGPGDHFGEIALIADKGRTATVTADTELRCYGLTRWEFRPVVESNPQVAWKLLEAVARMVREAEQRES
ncbi:MAG: cyclic nucleotide-binding domain-containing protein [Thermoleophilia bacterium]|nr:cyclic nucleotide-binding domain-containing protein [Thermoleophilia bacterium]